MRSKRITPCYDYCWVFITREKHSPQHIYIGMVANLPQLFRDNADKDILYYRQFATTVEGIGHKLFLSHIKEETLWHTIRGMNPEGRDLRKEFYE
ncbi:hypothetical protein M2137_001457 [Parabacteroides sp. PFB2-10]|uniref:hypothetical protein n=1 Tax=Parabacteroides sp. PFB2-10 TaxID=1742405 RepID=UPI002475D848|nr:hypothetical protein [Parabacteroides sp. PFB2-10]MDH6312682.1 hypothetical protein [Parabacteroides sp. PFB2-10]MDL2244036.1 hypothetical protein [Parabacteroides sp. OttesenSCG-928-J18]